MMATMPNDDTTKGRPTTTQDDACTHRASLDRALAFPRAGRLQLLPNCVETALGSLALRHRWRELFTVIRSTRIFKIRTRVENEGQRTHQTHRVGWMGSSTNAR